MANNAKFQERLDDYVQVEWGGQVLSRAALATIHKLGTLGVRVRPEDVSLHGQGLVGSVLFQSTAVGFLVERRLDLRIRVPKSNRVQLIAYPIEHLRDKVTAAIAEIFFEEGFPVRIATFFEDDDDEEFGWGTLYLEVLIHQEDSVEAFLSIRLDESAVELSLPL